MSTPGHLELCHPFCAANPVEQWPGPVSRDSVEYHNGRVVDREVTAWQNGVGFTVDVSDDNGPLATVAWRIRDVAGGSELTISLIPRTFRTVPWAVGWLPQLLVVRPMLRRYLRSVVTGVRWRLETGEPVTPNQFGRHRWFS